ncbi:MAG: retron system putative HNH endonuclease [Thermodesulfobacteriota bacterium]
MKYIIKGIEPQEFTGWKALANEDWAPTYGELRGVEKRVVHESLWHEQGGLCCYCENSIGIEDSHIEHFRPQNDPAVDPLDYGNMLCSCQQKDKKKAPQHCGKKKGGWFDSNLLISPLDPTCEDRFAFAADGSIRAKNADDEAAEITIKKLELDCYKLQRLRKAVIDGFLKDDLNDEEMKELVLAWLGPDNNGLFGAFYTTVTYLFGQWLIET